MFLDSQNPQRIIIDNVYRGMPNDGVKVCDTIMKYIVTVYPDAQWIWFAAIKNERANRIAKYLGFTESAYMDSLHDSNFMQGWEKKIGVVKKLMLSSEN